MVNKKKIIVENLKSLVIAFILAMFIRTFFVQAFKIPSSSMYPTLQVGDRLMANKLVYKFREPERGAEFPAKSPPDSYYVLGDNSINSKDSRYWACVPRKNFIGKPIFIYWPLKRIRIVR